MKNDKCIDKRLAFLVCRYVTAQRFSEALDILFSGACLELEHGLVCSLSFFVSIIYLYNCNLEAHVIITEFYKAQPLFRG